MRGFNKVNTLTVQHDLVPFRQPLILFLPKIDRQDNPGLGQARNRQQPDLARLDQICNCRRAAGDDRIPDKHQFDGVICDQGSAESDHLNGERGFSGTRRAEDQQPTPFDRHAGRVQQKRHCGGHTGRPTTKRAPRGSEVTSALVGRMFSAQMTPPCASTICFEMARPSPEWLPKSPEGRSE